MDENNTPAEHAAEALRCIEASPEAFDTDFWMAGPIDPLPPGIDPASCGTTLCVAGWIAHNAGYAIGPNGLVGDDDSVKQVAMELLDLRLDDANDLFLFSTDEAAIELLRSIAEGT